MKKKSEEVRSFFVQEWQTSKFESAKLIFFAK